MRHHLRQHRVACFLAITFAVSWSAWIALAARGETVTVGWSPLFLVGLLGPLIGAVATSAIVGGTPMVLALGQRMARLRVGLRWWAVAALPAAIAGVVYVVTVAYAMFLLAPVDLPHRDTLGQFAGFPATNAIVLAALLVAIGGFGEETGWRGFLLPALRRRHSPIVASLMIAAVWAVWHAPLFAIVPTYRAMPVALLPMFFIGLACGSFLLTWLYTNTRRSIAVVAVWHGLFDLFTGTAGAQGALAAVETTAVIALAVYAIARVWRRPPSAAPAYG